MGLCETQQLTTPDHKNLGPCFYRQFYWTCLGPDLIKRLRIKIDRNLLPYLIDGSGVSWLHCKFHFLHLILIVMLVSNPICWNCSHFLSPFIFPLLQFQNYWSNCCWQRKFANWSLHFCDLWKKNWKSFVCRKKFCFRCRHLSERQLVCVCVWVCVCVSVCVWQREKREKHK